MGAPETRIDGRSLPDARNKDFESGTWIELHRSRAQNIKNRTREKNKALPLTGKRCLHPADPANRLLVNSGSVGRKSQQVGCSKLRSTWKHDAGGAVGWSV